MTIPSFVAECGTCYGVHNQPRLASLGRTRETIEIYRGGANMYFHGEIYPLKLEMVINLTVVLRVGGPMGRVKICACLGGYLRMLDQRVCREKISVPTYS
jgi:hypothetical protein